MKTINLSEYATVRELDRGETVITFMTDDGYYHSVYLNPQELQALYDYLKERLK